MTGRFLALWAAAGSGFQVGGSMVATRHVVDVAGPASLGFQRYGIGFLRLFCGAACSVSYTPYVARYSALRVTWPC